MSPAALSYHSASEHFIYINITLSSFVNQSSLFLFHCVRELYMFTSRNACFLHRLTQKLPNHSIIRVYAGICNTAFIKINTFYLLVFDSFSNQAH